MSMYIEPIQGRHRLHIFGAGHVAAPTAALAARCGFQVSVVDEREDWCTKLRFPDAHTLSTAHHLDYVHERSMSPLDYVVITTHNHDHDREILGRMLEEEPGYVGMIGSTRKAQKALRELAAAGCPAEALERAHTPIGLDILAETPDEIAVSIVGEMIRHRHAHSSLKQTHGKAVASLKEGDGSQP